MGKVNESLNVPVEALVDPDGESNVLSLKERRALDLLQDQLELLAEQQVEGKNIHAALQKLTSTLPASMRKFAHKRYDLLVSRVCKDYRLEEFSQQFSDAQLAALNEIKALENPFIIKSISRTSLRKIRGLFLCHPAVIEAIFQMGKSLRSKGVAGFETTADLPAPSVPDLSNDKGAGQSR